MTWWFGQSERHEMASLSEAIEFATEAHEGQQRKYTGEPYVNHPIEVSTLLRAVPNCTPEMEQAAVLHDVLEDTDVTEAELREKFGDVVTDLVVELTQPRGTGHRKERVAKETYRLFHISPQAQTIKYADIICNSADIAEQDPDFAKTYLLEKLKHITVMGRGNGRLRQQAYATIMRGLLP